ncbi:unnamed protein product [Heterobilharzia americana]|nr:unnamed protein product [Heterobilharzia americana]
MNELEKLLSKATNPLSEQLNSDTLNAIAKLIDTQPNGPVFTLRLLAHKIKSPHEKEALSSLALLESLSRRCGPTFLSELGKFKFLNELIKVLSPKYLGDQTSSCVKNKCAQLLHDWQRDFSQNEPKISEAYNMLVREGIITSDQITSKSSTTEVCRSASSTAEDKQNIFERNKKSERLTQLLRSRNPADLREANALIKSIVEEDQVRMEKVSQRSSEMESLRNNTLLLEEMIGTYMLGESTDAELELMSELTENIRRARPLLYSFSLTHEEQDMETLTEIGRICDKASEVIENYERKVDKKGIRKTISSSSTHNSQSSSNENDTSRNHVPDLLTQDLMNLGLDEPITPLANTGIVASSSDVLLLNMSNHSPSNTSIESSPNKHIPTIEVCTSLTTNCPRGSKSNYDDLQDIFSTSNNVSATNSSVVNSVSPMLYPSIELDNLSRQMFELSKTNALADTNLSKLLGNDSTLYSQKNSTDNNNTNIVKETNEAPIDGDHNHNSIAVVSFQPTSVDLKSYDIQLSSIQPHTVYTTPVTLYPDTTTTGDDNINNSQADKNCIKLSLHYANNRPDPQVMVFVAVISSQNPLPITEINVRFGVEKPCKIRQLSASGENLPAYSPFLPAASISQVLLIHNPSKLEKFVLKFQLSFILDGEAILESGKFELPCA